MGVSEDEAVKIAKDLVKQDLEEDPWELFNHDFLNEHLYISDTDKRLIANDEVDAMMDGNQEYEDADKETKSKMESEKYDSTYDQLDKDPVGWCKELGGDEFVKDMIKKGTLQVDVKAATDEAVKTDGWAHFLSISTGDYKTTPGGIVYFEE